MDARKVEKSIRTLKLAAEMSQQYYSKPLIITYSGGKDSDVLLHLAESCLTAEEFEVLNSHTTVDAPETVYHIRETFERLRKNGVKATVKYSKDKDGKPITMWNLIPKKQIPPTLLSRYCCQVLKETSAPNRMVAVGVRSAESIKRQGRDVFHTYGKSKRDASYFSLEHAEEVYREAQELDEIWDCTLIKTAKQHGKLIVNPIYEWTDGDVWDYIRENNIQTNPLYERGYHRVGCIGCPLAPYHQKVKEFSDYPKYKEAYIRAFERMIIERKKAGKDDPTWKDAQAVFDWWTERWKHECKGQMNLFDEGN